MAGVTMKMLSESSCALLLSPLRFLQLLLCNVALALVNKMRNYWNVIKVGLPLYVDNVSLVFTFTNLLVQHLVALNTQYFGYESRYAWEAFGATCFHLLGAGSAYIVHKTKLQMFSSFIALILLGLAIFSITLGHDNTMPAFYLCQLLQLVYGLSGRRQSWKYYLLSNGLTVPLSLVSKGDARVKFKVSEEDLHLLDLDTDSWFELREDNRVRLKPNVRSEVILSVFSIEDEVVNFIPQKYPARRKGVPNV